MKFLDEINEIHFLSPADQPANSFIPPTPAILPAAEWNISPHRLHLTSPDMSLHICQQIACLLDQYLC